MAVPGTELIFQHSIYFVMSTRWHQVTSPYFTYLSQFCLGVLCLFSGLSGTTISFYRYHFIWYTFILRHNLATSISCSKLHHTDDSRCQRCGKDDTRLALSHLYHFSYLNVVYLIFSWCLQHAPFHCPSNYTSFHDDSFSYIPRLHALCQQWSDTEVFSSTSFSHSSRTYIYIYWKHST